MFSQVAGNQIATIIALALMGGFGFATVPAMQMRIMRHAKEAQTLGSGANIAAFNVGNAFGAWIGGITIAVGLGYASPLWACSLVTAASLVVLVIAGFSRGGGLRRSSIEPHAEQPAAADGEQQTEIATTGHSL